MSFEKFMSYAIAWPTIGVYLVAIVARYGWGKYYLNRRQRRVEPVTSESTFWRLAVIAGVAFSARVTYEYWPEIFGYLDFFCHDSGFETWWMVIIWAAVFTAFMVLVFFTAALLAGEIRRKRLLTELEQILRWDEYDAELAAYAKRDVLERCIINEHCNWQYDVPQLPAPQD